MKKYIAIFGLAILGLTFSSCEKEPSFNYPDGTVGISKVTNYPILTLKGDKRIIIAKGAAFNDPGVTALEGTNALTPVVTGAPDVATAGLYTVRYVATNKDGFTASITRQVLVYDPASSAAANDLSGNYARNTNGSVAVWTKIAPCFYSVFNPGGAPGTDLTVVIFNSTGSTIKIPVQESSDGTTTSSASETYNLTTKTYSMIIVNPGYGAASRTFIKQ
ncbi:protein of unknown function [Pedobacter westerhofensis]|uniref:Pesticidal crystal protein Cry22Aa Ig-like domain-containing protein n=1 Tax=Pedobacter westerhofensis TaxID=425512 RepID=A0A521DUH3_9SPHI|nr:immunoglobulin-like domain-containing protein [Pedobacter westerhofensis]SMO75295.1 protein of unknown function [Pedobacter westerhofensis]